VIVLDSSAVIAIMNEEPEATRFVTLIHDAPGRSMSAATYVECAIVASSRRGVRERLDEWLDAMGIDIISLDLGQARIAADAFIRFGKGRHPAGLNYGDCFSYALAAACDAPLLYKGTDFGKTDLRSASTSQA
jgi:ribonuclease VapC